jgi:hypothetical protein
MNPSILYVSFCSPFANEVGSFLGALLFGTKLQLIPTAAVVSTLSKPCPSSTLKATFVPLGRNLTVAVNFRLTDVLPRPLEWPTAGHAECDKAGGKARRILLRAAANHISRLGLTAALVRKADIVLVNARVLLLPTTKCDIAAYKRIIRDHHHSVRFCRDLHAGSSNEFVAPPRELGVSFGIRS